MDKVAEESDKVWNEWSDQAQPHSCHPPEASFKWCWRRNRELGRIIGIYMTLEEAKAKYPDEWLAFRISTDGENPQGEVVLHHHDRHVFDDQLLKGKLVGVYVTYSGPVLPEGYAALF